MDIFCCTSRNCGRDVIRSGGTMKFCICGVLKVMKVLDRKNRNEVRGKDKEPVTTHGYDRIKPGSIRQTGWSP
jgi:hypothetical protein